jgi:hypothetical protein
MLAIKDLAHAEEMDRAALEAVRGGYIVVNGTSLLRPLSTKEAIEDYNENGLPTFRRDQPIYIYAG